MKKLLVVLMMMVLMLTGCTKSTSSNEAGSGDASVGNTQDLNQLEKIKAAGKIVVGTSADYPPYEFHAIIDGKDEIVGFDIEIAKEIALALGVELEIQDMNFDSVLAGVGRGLIDIGIAGINPDPERDESMDFSQIYYYAGQTALVAADKASEYNSLEDFAGKTVGVQIGTVQEEIAKTQMEGTIVKSLGKNPDLVLELKTGMIDAILLEQVVAKSYAKQNPDLAVADKILIGAEDNGASVITAEGESELMDEINKILSELIASGKIEQFVLEANQLAEESVE